METVSNQRVLITGLTQSNFTKQLYRSLKNIAPGRFSFDVIDLRELSGNDEYGENIFDTQYRRKDFKTLSSIRFLLSSVYFRTLFYFFRRGVWAPKFLFQFTRRFLTERNLYTEIRKKGYDIFHFHSPKGTNLDMLWHLNKDDFCVISFWGSDLLRTAGFTHFALQSAAVERANIITTHSVETREIILAKFGRKHFKKIKFTRFPPYNHLYKCILSVESEKHILKSGFAEKYGLDPTKTWVVVGHNGASLNNHAKILESLLNLDLSIRKEIFLILPFSYVPANDMGYNQNFESVNKILNSGELKGKILRDFLSWEELALFRSLTEVFIHLPVSDALSAALTESIYAGSKIITGSWLPYNILRKDQLIKHWIDEFNELPAILQTALYDENEELPRIRAVIENLFFEEPCAKTWLEAFTHGS